MKRLWREQEIAIICRVHMRNNMLPYFDGQLDFARFCLDWLFDLQNVRTPQLCGLLFVRLWHWEDANGQSFISQHWAILKWQAHFNCMDIDSRETWSLNLLLSVPPKKGSGIPRVEIRVHKLCNDARRACYWVWVSHAMFALFILRLCFCVFLRDNVYINVAVSEC